MYVRGVMQLLIVWLLWRAQVAGEHTVRVIIIITSTCCSELVHFAAVNCEALAGCI